MALINLRGVTVSFGGPPLLDSVDLNIEPQERVCLVGRNGAGKTTLMRLIAGETEPDSGQVERGRDVRCALLSQEVPQLLNGTCIEVVGNGLVGGMAARDEQLHLVEATISRLNLEPNAMVEEMSGGLKRRVMLARALVSEPDVLLLDEPTNHLDIDSIMWVEEFLERYRGTILFVTHDRVFLKKLATRIVDIDRGKLTSWSCNFSAYLEKKQAMLDVEAAHGAKFNKKLAEEEIWIRKGVRERRTRNEGRVRALLKMREMARARRARSGVVKMRVQESGRTGKRIFEARDVTFSYSDDGQIIQHFSCVIYRGEKVGIIGANGIGKTTLLRLLLGELEPKTGEVKTGHNLEVAYLDQMREQLDDKKTVIENVSGESDKVIIDGTAKHIITYLKEFLFSPERAKTPVWVLSGGERNRLLLAKLFTRPSNVLVLDEPTNDLDTETLELLEERLLEFKGTVLFVSHDRAFLNNVATSTLVFERDGKISDYVGGYDDWLQQKGPALVEEKPKAPKEKKRQKLPPKRKLTFKEKRELEALPAEIEALEAERESIHESMADPEFYRVSRDDVAAAKSRLEELEVELAEAYAKWEDLEAIKEAMLKASE